MDEGTIRGLERLVDHEQGAVDSLERQFPSQQVRELPTGEQRRIHTLKMDAWRDLENAKTKLAEARAAFEKRVREKHEDAATRTTSANERMADASEAAARASADAARWAKWAAIFTAVAAAVTLASTVISTCSERLASQTHLPAAATAGRSGPADESHHSADTQTGAKAMSGPAGSGGQAR